MSRWSVIRVALAACVLVGCGDDSTPMMADAAIAVDGGVPLASPDIPWESAGAPPIEAPSAPADPYPSGPATTCPDGEARFFGSPACAPVGDACPAGSFAEGLPTDVPVVYVEAGAAGGDGSLSRPYGGLGEFSLGGLSRGSVVALSVGTYEGELRLPAGIVVWGACAGGTILQSTAPSATEGVVIPRGDGAALRNLSITDSPRPGILLSGAGMDIELSGVLLSGLETVGLRVGEGARLLATGLVVRGVRSRPTDFTFGRGLSVEAGAAVEIARAVIEGNLESGLYAGDPDTTVSLQDVIVRDTESQRLDGRLGRGISVQDGARLDLLRGAFVGNRDYGVYASGSATEATLTDLTVRDTAGRASDGTHGTGLGAFGGSVVTVERGVIEGSRQSAVHGEGADVAMTLTDVVLRGTTGQDADAAFGRGLTLQLGAAARLTRFLAEGNADFGVFAIEAGTEVDLQDAVVRDTEGQASDGVFGRGLGVQEGALARLARVLFENNREAALSVEDPGTTLTFEDVAVIGTRPRLSDGAAGRALNLQDGAEFTGSRLLLDRNLESAVFADGGGATMSLEHVIIRNTGANGDMGRGLSLQASTSARLVRARIEANTDVGVVAMHPDTAVELVDVVVEGTESRPSDGSSGYGIIAQMSANVSLTRVSIEGNRDVGLFATIGGAMNGQDVYVRDTRARDCAATTCVDAPSGSAIASVDASRVTLRDFSVTRAALCGVLVARGGVMDLTDGEVVGCTIGACVQTVDFDIGRITAGVRYLDNQVNLEATTLPLPEPVLAIGE